MTDARIKQIIKNKQDLEKQQVKKATQQTLNTTDAQNVATESKASTMTPTTEETDTVVELTAQNQDLKNKLVRALADLENVRKRGQEEIERAANYGFSKFATDLINVVENLFLAMDNVPTEAVKKDKELENFVYGIDLNRKELLKALEEHGIYRIFPLGEMFNHELHQAISKSPSEQPEDTIIQVVQAGYRIKDRLLKPALVIVATKQ